jgi:hypothetical protein
MIKQIIVLVIVVAFIFFALGLVSANQLIKTVKIGSLSSLTGAQNTFEAGWEAAKQRLKDSGFMPVMGNMEIKTVYGEVKQIKDNQIVIKIRPLEPLADPELDTRTVQIQDDTKVYQLAQNDPDKYQKEMEEFNKKMQEQMKDPGKSQTNNPIAAPEPFTKKLVSLSDVKQGQQISALAATNIITAKEFKAVEILIQSAPNAVVAPPSTVTPAEVK